MSKLKTIAFCVVLIGTATKGLTSAAPQDAGLQRETDPAEKSADDAKPKPPPPFTQRPDYIVEPPDLIDVEAQESLPGRPLRGVRLVRPNGTISLGWYGELFITGLTVPEIKVKIVNHLRQFIQDDFLGLVVLDDLGKPVFDPATGKPKRIDPKDSKAVRVKLTQCNSKFFYVVGEVLAPGQFPVTGTEKILDAINLAGGLSPRADLEKVVLYRERFQERPESFTIDVDQIKHDKRSSTNYLLKSGDRLVIRRRAGTPPGEGGSRSHSGPEPTGAAPPIERAEQREIATEDASLRRLEKRIVEMEHKLDVILEAIKRPGR